MQPQNSVLAEPALRAGSPVPGTSGAWPLERVLFALAGTATLLSAVLALTVTRWAALLGVVVGLNQWLYVISGSCPASILLRRTCDLRSAVEPPADRSGALRDPVGV